MTRGKLIRNIAIASAVAVPLALVNGPLGAQETRTPMAPQAVAGPNGLSIYSESSGKSGQLMKVTILGPEGEVRVNRVVPADEFHWAPKARNGRFRYEAYILQGDEAAKRGAETDGRPPVSVNGTLKVRNGSIEAKPTPAELGERRKDLSSIERPGLLERAVGFVLGAFATEAHAQDLEAEDTTPSVIFDDTSNATTKDWEIFTNQDVSGEDLWRLFDRENGGTAIFDIRSDSTNGNVASLGIKPNGAINLSDGDFFMEGGSGNNLGLGTTTPIDDLHITDGNPAILLEDSTDATDVRLLYNAGEFVIEGNGSPDIVTLDATAPADSIVMDASGNVGMSTSSPDFPLTVNGTLGFEDGTSTLLMNSESCCSGNSRMIWAHSPSFSDWGLFYDDSGDNLHIQSASGSEDVTFDFAGNMGVGAVNPQAPVHVQQSDGSASVLVEDTGGTSPLSMFQLKNSGFPRFTLTDSSTGEAWDFRLASGKFTITRLGTGGPEFEVLNNGDAELRGTLTEGSSRSIKRDIDRLDGKTVLAKLEQMPISEWSYKNDPAERHAGPMAEDFHATFGLGPGPKHISPSDLAGVALAAAKSLAEQTQSLKKETTDLRDENERLKAKLSEMKEIRERLNELEQSLAK